MYKINIGPGFTKYFLSYSEATSYAKACGFTKRKIKPVH